MTPDAERRAAEARLTKAVTVTERAKLALVRVKAADIRVLLDALAAADARAARLRAVVENAAAVANAGRTIGFADDALQHIEREARAELEETTL